MEGEMNVLVIHAMAEQLEPAVLWNQIPEVENQLSIFERSPLSA
jgi:hypothetical protein